MIYKYIASEFPKRLNYIIKYLAFTHTTNKIKNSLNNLTFS